MVLDHRRGVGLARVLLQAMEEQTALGVIARRDDVVSIIVQVGLLVFFVFLPDRT